MSAADARLAKAASIRDYEAREVVTEVGRALREDSLDGTAMREALGLRIETRRVEGHIEQRVVSEWA